MMLVRSFRISQLTFICFCTIHAMEKLESFDTESYHLHYSLVESLQTLCCKAVLKDFVSTEPTPSLDTFDTVLKGLTQAPRETLIAVCSAEKWFQVEDKDKKTEMAYTPELKAHLSELISLPLISKRCEKIPLQSAIPKNIRRYTTAGQCLIYVDSSSRHRILDVGRDKIFITDLTTGKLKVTHLISIRQYIGKMIGKRNSLCFTTVKPATIFDDILIQDLSDESIDSIECHKGFPIDFNNNLLACTTLDAIEIFGNKKKKLASIPCNDQVKGLSVDRTYLAAHLRNDSLEENYLAIWNWKTGEQLHHRHIVEFFEASVPAFIALHNGKVLYLTTAIIIESDELSAKITDCFQLNLFDIQSGTNTILVSSFNKYRIPRLRHYQLHGDQLYHVQDLSSIHSVNLTSGNRITYPIPNHEKKITNLKILGTVDHYLIAHIDQRKTSDCIYPDDKGRSIVFWNKHTGAYLHQIYGVGLAVYNSELYFLPSDSMLGFLYKYGFKTFEGIS